MFRQLVENAICFNLTNMTKSWFIVSKAFERSTNRLETYSPLSLLLFLFFKHGQ